MTTRSRSQRGTTAPATVPRARPTCRRSSGTDSKAPSAWTRCSSPTASSSESSAARAPKPRRRSIEAAAEATASVEAEPPAPEGYAIVQPHPLIEPDAELNARLRGAGLQPGPGAARLRTGGRAPAAGDQRRRWARSRRSSRWTGCSSISAAPRPGGIRRGSSRHGQRANLARRYHATLAASYDGVLALHQMMRASEPELLGTAGAPAAELEPGRSGRDDARPALLAAARSRVHRPRHGWVQAALRRLTRAGGHGQPPCLGRGPPRRRPLGPAGPRADNQARPAPPPTREVRSMSTSIDQAFVKQFEAEVQEAYQRQGSKLRPTVRSKTERARQPRPSSRRSAPAPPPPRRATAWCR